MAKHRVVTVLFLLFFVFCARTLASQTEEIKPGRVIEKIVLKSDPQQSYALYLPTGYTAKKKWPILYAFDAAARGALPVNLYKDAAEKFGFILVGSNNSRNGIQVAEFVQALWNDTHQRFAIDPERTYTTGFSGGARVATAVAISYSGVAGVIASSGGFPAAASPTANLPFVYFATAGTEDFNFPEMQQLHRKLEEVGMTNHLAVFEGTHQWPPVVVANYAIAWMEMQAMKKGLRPKDEALIERLFSERREQARSAEATGQNFAAYLEYETLASDFAGLRDVKEVKANADRLAATKEIKAAIKNLKSEEDRQRDWESKLQKPLAQLSNSVAAPEALSELQSLASELARKAEDGNDVSEKRVARRVLAAAFSAVYENADRLFLQKKYGAALQQLEIGALLKPKNMYVFYELALGYARAGNKGKAIEALKRAVENGFNDAGKIEQETEFQPLRNEAGYQKIVLGLRKGM